MSVYLSDIPYHYKGLEGETTADLAKAVNAEIGGGGHIHPDSDEELHFQPEEKEPEKYEELR